jgi:uncharacterized protein YukE
MADTRVLLEGLREYAETFDHHVADLRSEWERLRQSWIRLDAVYEGDAAEHFKEGWMRTARRFDEYLQEGGALKQILEERIEALEDVNRPERGVV